MGRAFDCCWYIYAMLIYVYLRENIFTWFDVISRWTYQREDVSTNYYCTHQPTTNDVLIEKWLWYCRSHTNTHTDLRAHVFLHGSDICIVLWSVGVKNAVGIISDQNDWSLTYQFPALENMLSPHEQVSKSKNRARNKWIENHGMASCYWWLT